MKYAVVATDLQVCRKGRQTWRSVATVGLTVVWCVLSASVSATLAADWPQWRGPTGNSVSSETNLPLFWSEDRNVRFKAELPEWGTSTPAIWGDCVFITTQQDEALLALRLDKLSGKLAWTRQLGSGVPKREGAKREQKFHRLQNMASPSPVTDGEVVVVHFGSGDLAALDFEGKVLWQRNLEKEYGAYTIWWGHANSPVLYKDLVISVCMQDSLIGIAEQPSPSYLVAHHKLTGREVWKSMRMTKADAEQCDSYTTPIFCPQAERLELVVMGGNQLDAYDPATGKQLWYLPGLIGGRTITGPTFSRDTIYATQGQKGPLVAVKAGGVGELPKQSIIWKQEQGTPDSSTPVVLGGLLFMITDNGIAKCFDGHTGHLKWESRLPGDYKASPLAAEGRIYFLNTHGLCTVVSAATRFEKLAENQLDDEMLASPVTSDGRLYLRGKKALYCLDKK